MANYDASSTNKSKKSTRTYVDLDLDFTSHPVTNDVVKITDVEAVKRSVRNLIKLPILVLLLLKRLRTIIKILGKLQKFIFLYKPRERN